MTPRARRAILAALAAASLLAAAPPPLPAAPGEGTWSVEDSEEVRARLEEADRLLGRGLPEKGVPLLQEILDRWPDHLVRNGADPLRFEGARVHVLRRIRSFSPAEMAAYRAFAGPRAAAALERGLRLRDADALERDGLRLALAGPDGARLLLAAADLRLARGEPGRAVAPLEALLREFPGEPAGGPAVAARLARARSRTGDGAGVARLAAAWAGRLREAVPAAEGATTLGAILEEAARAAGPLPSPADAPTLGGGPDRRGAGPWIEALGPVRWTEPNGRFGWTQKDEAQASRETSVQQSLERAEPVVPALADGVLFLQGSHEVVARDLYTGRERWRFRGPAVARAESARTHGSLLFAPAVAGGVVFAPLQVWPEGEPVRNIIFAGQDIIPHIPVRRLFALEAATGRLLWAHAEGSPGPGLPMPDRLRMLNLTSPPLVQGDAVVAAGASYRVGSGFTLWALAADRGTGALRWATRLGYGQQELNLFGRTIKEIPVAAVASDGERLFVQTNAGFVACLDAASGRPLWTRAYRQEPIPPYESFWNTPERRFTWTGSPPVVAGGKVIVAPADGAHLLALHAETGELAWSAASRDGVRYDAPRVWRLLGASEGRVYVAGTSVRALDLADGRSIWDRPFPAREEASSGRGVVAGNRLLVPTRRALYALDASAGGRILRADPFAGDGEGGGNLVTTDGAAILVRWNETSVHYRDEEMGVRARRMVAERPGSPEVLLEAARLLLAADRPAEARPLLEKALALPAAGSPEARAAREREIRTALSLVRERVALDLLAAGRDAEARDAFLAAAGLAPDAAVAAALLLRGARALQTAPLPRPAAAAEILEVVAARHAAVLLEGEALPGGDPGGRSSAGALALHLLSRDASERGDGAAAVAAMQRVVEGPAESLLHGEPAPRRARAILDELLGIHGPESYAAAEASAAAALAAARRSADPASLAAVARRWPNSRAAVEASLEEARLRVAAGDGTGAVAAMRRLLAGHLEEGDAAEALWLLAEGHVRSGRASSARATLQRLLRLHPDARVGVEGRPTPVAEAVERRLASPDLAAGAPEAEGLAARPAPWKEAWTREVPPGAARRLVVPAGEALPGGRVLLLAGSTLQALDGATGAPAWSAERPVFRGRALSAGGLLLFALDREAAALDPATGEIAWTRDLPGGVEDAVICQSQCVLLLVDEDDPDTVRVVALDPSTGDPAWTASTALPGGASALHARNDGVLADGTGTSFPALRLLDGGDGNPRGGFVPLRRGRERPGIPVPAAAGPILLRRDDSLEGYDPGNLRRLWPWSPPGSEGIAAVASAGEKALAVLDEEGTLRVLDPLRGRETWSLPPGRDRLRDLSPTALACDGDRVFTVSAREDRGGISLEAHRLADGAPHGTAPISEAPALVEIAPAGACVIVRYLVAGAGVGGRSGVAVVDRATMQVLDRFEDDRLGGEGFLAVPVGGRLVIATERAVWVRGR